MRKKEQTTRTIRFRQWSRKGYAAFISLGVCVTIGCLRKSVTECALLKQIVPQPSQPEEKQANDCQERQDDGLLPENGIGLLATLLQMRTAFINRTAGISQLPHFNTGLTLYLLIINNIKLWKYVNSVFKRTFATSFIDVLYNINHYIATWNVPQTRHAAMFFYSFSL